MKQKFIAIFVALAFISFGWAAPKHSTTKTVAPSEEEEAVEEEAVEEEAEEDNDSTEIEEEDSEEEEAVVAPAPKAVKKAKKTAPAPYFLGFGTDLLGDNFGYWRATLNINADISLYILLNYATSTTTTKTAGVSVSADYSFYGIGAGGSYGFATPILPSYAGLALIYHGNSADNDYMGIDFQLFAGIKASPVKGFEIAAQPALILPT
jgi:hypothetical protein